jgi:hypothetical protein
MPSPLRNLIATVATVIVVAGCSADGTLDVAEDIAPLTTSTSAAGTVTYAANVFKLDAATTDAAAIAADHLTFPIAGTRGIAGRKPGDILVSATGSANRFLAKVVSVQKSGTSWVVTYTNAALTDAVKDASLTMTLGGAQPAKARPSGPAPLETHSGGLFGNGTIDVAASAGVACGPNMKCVVATGQKITPTLGGSITPSASIDFDLQIHGFNVDHLLFVAHGSLQALATLGIKVEQKGAYRLEVSLYDTQVPVLVGDIPTVVKLKLVVGGEGELFQPAVEYKLTEGFQTDVAAGVEMGADHVFHGVFNESFTPITKFERNGQITETKGKLYFGLKVGWLVGVAIADVTVLEAGPELAYRWYVQGNAYANGPGDGPWFETDRGSDISAVGTVDFLGIVGGGISLKLKDEYTVVSREPLPRDVFYFLPCFLASDGDYCGQEVRDNFKLGTPDHLYECYGGQQMFDEACQYGCGPATGVDQAQGKRVACNPAPNNPCHAAADGNYCGSENVDGFIGGKLGLPASAQITCAGGNVSRQISCSAGCGPVPGNARVGCLTPLQGPSAPCGAGDQAGPHNGTCGPDGRVYYCYQGVWRVKDDCLAKQQMCEVQPPGVADICVSTAGGGQRPPSAPCGAGDQNGPHNGTCGPDGRVYYCYQGVWRLKDDCIAKSQSCVIEPPGVADICQSQSRRLTPPTAPCGAGDQGGPHNGTCGPDGRVYYCYQGAWNLLDDCVARGAACVVEPAGVADVCATGCSASGECATGENCDGGRCVCPGPVCGTSCCGADEWCGSGSRCCSGCTPGCPC